MPHTPAPAAVPPVASGTALLDRLEALERRLLRLGPGSRELADWVRDEHLARHAMALLRELPRVPYALRCRPAAFLYIAWHAGLFEAALERIPLGEAAPCPTAPHLQAHGWAVRAAMHGWADAGQVPLPVLDDAARRNLLAELPRGGPVLPEELPWIAVAARLVAWAVEMGPRDWLPLLLALPAARGRVTAAVVCEVVDDMWERHVFERNTLARLAGCLHAAHPGLLPAGRRKAMVLFDALRPELTAPLLRLGMMDGWRRDPHLGRMAAVLGFWAQLRPFVWYSQLSGLEWELVVRAACSYDSQDCREISAAVRRWVALRDVLRVGGPRWGRLGALPDRPARTVADFLGLGEDYALRDGW
jgi:hypothetical protein